MNIKKIIILFILLSITIINNSFARENKILVKVNNEIITTIDILNEIKFLTIVNKEFKNIEKEKQIRIAKNSLIREKVKTLEILKFRENLKLEDGPFNQILQSYFSTENIKNFEEFKIFLKKNDLKIETVREKISIDRFWKALIYEKFHKHVKINETEIKKSVLQMDKQNEYLLSEIVFSLNEDEKLDEKLKKINNLILDKNFAEAAFNYSISDTSSNGGELGWIKESVLNKKIKKKLRNIEIGEFTNPIVIPGGFLILKKENSRKIKKDLNIENEIKIIIDQKTNDQLNRYSNIYLNKLKKNIKINEI